ncbi:MAG: PilZ domain-containing protein [Candidatus Omnitrophota bacterium]
MKVDICYYYTIKGRKEIDFIKQKKEKRQFHRVSLRTRLRYQVRGEPEYANTISDNISEGGVAFVALKFIPPATALMLELDLLNRTLYPIGRVSWCQPLPHSQKNRLGVEFIEFNQFEKNLLSDYIKVKIA